MGCFDPQITQIGRCHGDPFLEESAESAESA